VFDIRIFIACGVAASASAIAIPILLRVAGPAGLVDHPDSRKRHIGNVPLIGGLATLVGLLTGMLYYTHFLPFTYVLVSTAAVLAVLGALDDRFDLSVKLRLLVQTSVILAVIGSTGVHIHTLGYIFGQEIVFGPWLGIPLTLVAVIGLMNAFNLMDGIDGLAGGLALISIAAIFVFAVPTPLIGAIALLALLGAALLPYLACNLGFMGRKIFMGDAGSMVIGYLLAWTLIRLSQHPETHLSPIDVLWCVALPVVDTLAVMYRRLRQGKSPFKPDRGHIHHILMDMGLSSRTTLVVLIALAASIAFMGSVTSSLGLGSGSNLVAFCVFTGFYIITVTRIRTRQIASKPSLVSTTRPTAYSGNILSLEDKRAVRVQDTQPIALNDAVHDITTSAK
jgi:UDP-GlcNAc:undecaprenyl-phosphate GlcNAc-1-phosphate transferase